MTTTVHLRTAATRNFADFFTLVYFYASWMITLVIETFSKRQSAELKPLRSDIL